MPQDTVAASSQTVTSKRGLRCAETRRRTVITAGTIIEIHEELQDGNERGREGGGDALYLTADKRGRDSTEIQTYVRMYTPTYATHTHSHAYIYTHIRTSLSGRSGRFFSWGFMHWSVPRPNSRNTALATKNPKGEGEKKKG